MARDIEEFLRRAAERRQQQKANQGQAPQRQQSRRQRPVVEAEVVEIVEPEIVPQADSRRSSIQKQRLKSGIKATKKPDLRRESVSEHVASHLDSGRLARKSSKLGERIASVHDRVEQNVHQHLDHDLSKLDDRPTITDDPRAQVAPRETTQLAKDLVEMLTEPKSIRQAILISEILNPLSWDDV